MRANRSASDLLKSLLLVLSLLITITALAYGNLGISGCGGTCTTTNDCPGGDDCYCSGNYCVMNAELG